MSRRKKFLTKVDYDEMRVNIARTSVLCITVSEYSRLPKLGGVNQDAKMIEEIFKGNNQVSLYSSSFSSLHNPTANQIRKTLIEYATNRSARGDILIFYYSGHGSIVGTNEFAFCPKDATHGLDESKLLPLSLITFRDVVQTLSAVDVHPVFIIDACFSGSTAPQGTLSVLSQSDLILQSYYANSYALLASTSLETMSFETSFGGHFTRTLHSIIVNGLGSNEGRHMPFLSLEDLSLPLQEKLAKTGHPLSKSYIGTSLPLVPIARNAKFSPDTEKFVPYMRQIIEYMWNEGSPRPVTPDDILKNVGKGAYANHSKLSLKPWSLISDDKSNSKRVLTERGKLFAQGKISIPETIIRDAVTWEWVASPETKEIKISDVGKKQPAQPTLALDSFASLRSARRR